MTMSPHTLLLAVVGCLPLVAPLPSGPPLSACTSLRPGTQPGQTGQEGHLNLPQNEWPIMGYTREPPFYIQVYLPLDEHGQYVYSPNQQISVGFVTNQTYGLFFYRGLFAQVREVHCADNKTAEVGDEPIGDFILPPSAETLLKDVDCHDMDNSAVGHYSPQLKVNETVTWRAPSGMRGNLIIKATFVHYANIFWTEVYSKVLRDPGVGAPPVCRSSTTTYTSALLVVMAILSISQR